MFDKNKERKNNPIQYLIVTLFLVVFHLSGTGQTRVIDSLRQVVQSTTHSDSLKVKALSHWDNLIYRSDADLDAILNSRIDSISRIQLSQELSAETRQFFLKARSHALNNKGIVLKKKGDISGALECYLVSLEIKKELGNLAGVSNSTNNIGNLYLLQGEYDLAAEFIQQALAIRDSLKDTLGMAECYNNLGSVKRRQEKKEESLSYFQKSDSLYQLLDTITDKSLIAVSNIGVHYSYFSGAAEKDKAMFYYRRALEGAKEISSVHSMAIAHKNIGIIYFHQKKYKDAIWHARQAVDYCEEVQDNIAVTDAYHTLYRSYQELGDAQKALPYYEQYVTIRDSIKSRENERNILQYKYQYLYEKKAYADSLETVKAMEMKDTQLALQEAEINRGNYQMAFLIGGLILIVLLTGVVYQRLRVTRMENELNEKQKKLDLSLVISDNKMRKEFNEQLLHKLDEFGHLKGEELHKALSSFQLDVKNQLRLEDRLEHASDNLDQLHAQFDENLQQLFPSLTKSEREVFHLIRVGMSIKEIANHRNSSVGAVKSIRHRIKNKLPLGDKSLDLYIREVT
ncbi:tetratricopeptide repeat protein [bacterium SCSIO 12741]|nr:tetratricopeptide repeat protein [bacterium SCSIO 12741]